MNHTSRKTGISQGLIDGMTRWMALVPMFAILFAMGGVKPAEAQTIPNATAATTQLLQSTFATPYVGRPAANSLGDVVYVTNSGYSNATIYWLQHGTTTPVVLATTTGSSTAKNAFIDSSNNLYIANLYGANIIEFPFVNGGYTVLSSTAFGALAACNSYTPTAPCLQFGSPGAAAGYYSQPVDVGVDGSGNGYVLYVYSNGSCTADCIVKFTKSGPVNGGAYTPSLLIGALSGGTSSQIAVDTAGNIFFVNGTTQLEEIAAGTTSAVAFGTGFTSPAGISIDNFGNLYVTNAATPYAIFEFPQVNGVPQTQKQYAVLGTYSNNGVGVDGLGDMFYGGYSAADNLNVAHINNISLGSANVGSVAAGSTSVTFTFAQSTTVTGITSTGSGFTYAAGSCAAATYAANGTCTVNVAYTPSAVGLQRGAVNLNTTNGTALASALLYGKGLGSALVTDPGTVTAIGSGLVSPQGIAVDASGNVYIADAGQNTVLRYAGGAGTPTNIGTGLSKPNSIALDNAGNLYIADSGNGRVVEVPNVNGTLTSSAQSVVITGLGTQLAVRLDFAGNLYIADTSKTKVTELYNIGGQPRTTQTASLGTFVAPNALAVDSNGNLIVADGQANSVYVINYLGSKTPATITAALSAPQGVATDASGSVYVADTGNSRLIKIPLEGTAYNTNDQYLVGATVAVPYGVALDPAGNLYVIDNANKVADFINRAAAAINLGRVQIPGSSLAQNATLGNAGNTALTFGTPQYTAVSAQPTYFQVTSPATGGCAAGGTVAAGYSCLLSAVFSPTTTTGTFTDVLTFNSNAANTGVKTLTLTGTAVNLAVDTLTLTQTSGAATFGQPVTIQAAVTSTVAGTPTGTVSFTVDGNTQSTMPSLNGSGVASITLAGLTGGSHQVCGSYTGDNNYRPSTNCITITVAKVPTTTSLVITCNTGACTTPVTSPASTAVTLTATVVPSAQTPPTGNVTFSVGGTTLGTAPIVAGSTYTATLVTSALPVGNDTVVATYNGDTNYLTSSGSASDIVTYPTFFVTPATNRLSVPKIGSGQLTLSVTSLGLYAGTVGLRCSGLPANTICTFSPNGFQLAANSPQVVTLQVSTGQSVTVPQPTIGSVVGGSAWLGLISFGVLMAFARKSLRTLPKFGRMGIGMVAFLLLGLGLGSTTGCGGSGFNGDTPTGTYTVTISATGTTPPVTNPPTNYPYGLNLAPGCSLTPNATTPSAVTYVTCTETATLSLVVTP